MKFRKGFVSNSSTTSFIIETNDEREDLTVEIVVRIDLRTMVEQKTYRTIAEYEEENPDDDKWGPKIHQKITTALKNGKVVFKGQLGDEIQNYESLIEEFLRKKLGDRLLDFGR